jgi:hypothetical protein
VICLLSFWEDVCDGGELFDVGVDSFWEFGVRHSLQERVGVREPYIVMDQGGSARRGLGNVIGIVFHGDGV